MKFVENCFPKVFCCCTSFCLQNFLSPSTISAKLFSTNFVKKAFPNFHQSWIFFEKVNTITVTVSFRFFSTAESCGQEDAILANETEKDCENAMQEKLPYDEATRVNKSIRSQQRQNARDTPVHLLFS